MRAPARPRRPGVGARQPGEGALSPRGTTSHNRRVVYPGLVGATAYALYTQLLTPVTVAAGPKNARCSKRASGAGRRVCSNLAAMLLAVYRNYPP